MTTMHKKTYTKSELQKDVRIDIPAIKYRTNSLYSLLIDIIYKQLKIKFLKNKRASDTNKSKKQCKQYQPKKLLKFSSQVC